MNYYHRTIMESPKKVSVLRRVIGGTDELDLQHRFVNSVSFFGVVLGLLAVIINFLAGLGWLINTITLAGAMTSGALYYLSRFKNMYQQVVWPLIATLLMVLDATWFINAGIERVQWHTLFCLV